MLYEHVPFSIVSCYKPISSLRNKPIANYGPDHVYYNDIEPAPSLTRPSYFHICKWHHGLLCEAFDATGIYTIDAQQIVFNFVVFVVLVRIFWVPRRRIFLHVFKLKILFGPEVGFWAPMECLGALVVLVYLDSSVDFVMMRTKMNWERREMRRVIIYLIPRFRDQMFLVCLRDGEISTRSFESVMTIHASSRIINNLLNTHQAELLTKFSEIESLEKDRAQEVANLKKKTDSEIDSLKEKIDELKAINHQNVVKIRDLSNTRYNDHINFAHQNEGLERKISDLKKTIPYPDLHEELLRLRDERSALLKEKKKSDRKVKHQDRLEAENQNLRRLPSEERNKITLYKTEKRFQSGCQVRRCREAGCQSAYQIMFKR